MKRVFDHLRERLLLKAGLIEPQMSGVKWDALKAEVSSDGFVDLMDNRLIMGRFRYGPMKATKPVFYDVERAKDRIRDYESTGNTEFLIDAANYLRLEKLRGRHPDKHFHAVDRIGD